MSTEARRILIVNGHPDAGARHLLHQLIDAYANGAQAAGHAVRRVDVAALDFPLLRSAADWEHGTLPASLKPVRRRWLCRRVRKVSNRWRPRFSRRSRKRLSRKSPGCR